MTLQILLVADISNNLFTDLLKIYNVKINVIQPKIQYSSLVSDNPTLIEIIGTPKEVEDCRVRILVLLDEKVKEKVKKPCYSISDNNPFVAKFKNRDIAITTEATLSDMWEKERWFIAYY